MLLRKVINYSGIFIIIVMVLGEFNVNLTTILGAAGIVGIAVGVASKNSLGNIISGLFLISEKSFEVGDVITIGDKTGIVHSIDLLSIKLRTFTNLYVRIPNEKIINSDLINITKFPIRRMDFEFTIVYKEDLEQVQNCLIELAKKNRYSLNEPEPLFIIKKFGDRGIEILIGLWFEKNSYMNLKNGFTIDIKKKFKELKIDFALPYIHVKSDHHDDVL